MISTLTLVSLGLLQTGAIEIVMLKPAAAPATPKSNVVDPAKAEIADIDAAVREYAIEPATKAIASHHYRDDKPCPPLPPIELDFVSCAGLVSPRKDVAITKTVSIDKSEQLDLETLKPSTAFVVLRQEERPSWVAQAPQLKGNGEHFIAVSSDPWKTDFEASESLEKKLRTAVDDYINDQIGRPDAARRIHLPKEVVDQLIGERYAEDLQFSDDSIGAMKQTHAKLVFTPQFRAAVAERWKEHVVNGRLLRTGILSAGVLLLLVMAFGVLKRLGRR